MVSSSPPETAGGDVAWLFNRRLKPSCSWGQLPSHTVCAVFSPKRLSLQVCFCFTGLPVLARPTCCMLSPTPRVTSAGHAGLRRREQLTSFQPWFASCRGVKRLVQR